VGLTVTEKIIAARTGRCEVKPGEIVEVPVDVAYLHDNNAPIAIEQFHRLSKARVWDPGRVFFILDHHSPASTFRASRHHRDIREFAYLYGCHIFDVGRGVSHPVMAEEGIIRPGKIIVGSDSHTVGAGTFGCLATGIGSTEMASVLATGRIWMRVPETVKIVLKGQMPFGVSAKDVALLLLRHFGPSGLNYKAVEFDGSLLKRMTIAERMTIAIMCLEMGVKNALMPIDAQLMAELRTSATKEEIYLADKDAVYTSVVHFDVSELQPLVAVPAMPANGEKVERVEGTTIHQAILGSCSGGFYHDLKEAAEILQGKRVHPQVRFIIVPNTSRVMAEAVRTGVAQVLLEAGAIITAPSCGPCGGYEVGCLAPGEVCISTTTRNMDGRMGPGGEIYLASARTVAASAVAGKITDPRKYLSRSCCT
jgi:3-isopropylmalate dehydratase large subunit